MEDQAIWETLKSRQRRERDAWPEDFGLRIHRSISWVKRATQEADDPAAAFLFYWIAFNAAYGGESEYLGERDAFETFFIRLCRLDGGKRIYDIVWSDFPGPIRLFMENRYVFAPFWAHVNDAKDTENWEERFNGSKIRFYSALKSNDTALVLSLLFDRLYVLRNQLIHGGSTWGSKVNRDQLRDGSAILQNLVPIMIDLMMDAPTADWGTPMYPVIEN